MSNQDNRMKTIEREGVAMNKERASVIPQQLESFSLPPNFLFGVSNAAFQVEGGYNQAEGPRNNWAEWERAGKVETSGNTCNFWDRYAEHVDLASSMGLNAFRMSVEWARLQPSTSEVKGSAPPWDENALDRYSEIIGSVIEAGMEPVITLHHFTHPAWLGQDIWLDRATPRIYADYVFTVARELNLRLIDKGHHPIRLWVTLNEPNILAPLTHFLGEHPHAKKGISAAREAANNLIIAHVLGYNALHDLYEDQEWEAPQVSITIYCNCFYALDRGLLDMLTAPFKEVSRAGLYKYLELEEREWKRAFDEMARARWDRSLQYYYYRLLDAVYSRLSSPPHYQRAVDAIYDSPRRKLLDYIGLDIYDPFVATYLPKIPTPRRIREREPLLRVPLWENRYLAREFSEVVRAHHRGVEDLPIYIMENGMCHRQEKGGRAQPRADGLIREVFLKKMLGEVAQLIAEKVPLKGYLFWSLTDNYEWGSFEPRFGLFEYDYEEGRIKETDGLGTPAGKVYAELVKALISGNLEEINRALGG